MTVMDFPSSPINGQTTTDGRYYFDSSVGTAGAWRSAPLPVGGLPAGSIIQWSSNTAPANWLICDGAAVSRSVYSSLFAVIGTTYGAGDGSTTFNLPDLRGRVPVGKNGGTFGTLGASGGAETHTLTEAQMPSHSHNTGGSPGIYKDYIGSGTSHAFLNYTTSATVGNPFNTNSVGGGAAHNNLQPYLVTNYIIKTSAGWTAGDSELATRVGALETADATTNKSGLVPIVPSSVSVGSGSASVSTGGLITVSGASSLTLNNCFPSTYRLFKLVWELGSTTQIDLNVQFRGGGSTVASNYYGATYTVSFGGTAGSTNTRSGGTNASIGFTGTETGVGEVIVSTQQTFSGAYKPHLSMSGYSRPHGAAFFGGYGANAGAITDSFVITPSTSTISGTLTIYGLR